MTCPHPFSEVKTFKTSIEYSFHEDKISAKTDLYKIPNCDSLLPRQSIILSRFLLDMANGNVSFQLKFWKVHVHQPHNFVLFYTFQIMIIFLRRRGGELKFIND